MLSWSFFTTSLAAPFLMNWDSQVYLSRTTFMSARVWRMPPSMVSATFPTRATVPSSPASNFLIISAISSSRAGLPWIFLVAAR